MLVDDTRINREFLLMGGYWMLFSFAGEGTKVGMHSLRTLFVLMVRQLEDYGHFSDSGQLCSQGNIFSHFKFRIPEADIIPREQEMTAVKINIPQW